MSVKKVTYVKNLSKQISPLTTLTECVFQLSEKSHKPPHTPIMELGNSEKEHVKKRERCVCVCVSNEQAHVSLLAAI